ncbi:hypothetical protein [Spongiimicrobium salis]|uniref:hypothetical protein n=1 Tax=Spongiimicrobium salis TaxID=1667022 RepID=UPI00374DCC3D
MSTNKTITLSSQWTNISLYGTALLCILSIPLLWLVWKNQELHMGMLIAPIILMVLLGGVIYQFLYVCNAQLIGDVLVLKKKFRPEKKYTFDAIGYPTSFQLKTTRYITVEMKNGDGTLEKYLILNSRALLSFENKDAEQTLIELRNRSRV